MDMRRTVTRYMASCYKARGEWLHDAWGVVEDSCKTCGELIDTRRTVRYKNVASGDEFLSLSKICNHCRLKKMAIQKHSRSFFIGRPNDGVFNQGVYQE